MVKKYRRFGIANVPAVPATEFSIAFKTDLKLHDRARSQVALLAEDGLEQIARQRALRLRHVLPRRPCAETCWSG